MDNFISTKQPKTVTITQAAEQLSFKAPECGSSVRQTVLRELKPQGWTEGSGRV